ncbi:MAG: hypothetical protein R6U52_05920 [Kosmotogaceae bacterium]
MLNKGRLWISSQIFLNEELTKELELKIRDKLNLFKKIGLNSLMIWSTNIKYLDPLVNICKETGISSYLWYPLLADTPVDFVIDPYKVVGVAGDNKSQILEAQKDGGEEFAFLCPNKVREEPAFFNSYKRILESADLDGVFLDRIRFPSPANGLNDFASCLCDTCRKKSPDSISLFKEEFSQFRNKMVEAKEKDEIKELIKNFWISIEKFLSFREQSVLALVSDYTKFAHDRGLDVGIDLFSPSLSRLVSQNFEVLSNVTNWIKPMIYCKTMGPAGLPMEFLSLIRMLKSFNKNITEKMSIEVIEELKDIKLPQKTIDFVESGISLDNYETELKKINSMNIPDDVNVYPGFEGVHLPPISSVNLETLRSYIKITFENNFRGFVLSWDIKSITEKNINFVGDALERYAR